MLVSKSDLFGPHNPTKFGLRKKKKFSKVRAVSECSIRIPERKLYRKIYKFSSTHWISPDLFSFCQLMEKHRMIVVAIVFH